MDWSDPTIQSAVSFLSDITAGPSDLFQSAPGRETSSKNGVQLTSCLCLEAVFANNWEVQDKLKWAKPEGKKGRTCNHVIQAPGLWIINTTKLEVNYIYAYARCHLPQFFSWLSFCYCKGELSITFFIFLDRDIPWFSRVKNIPQSKGAAHHLCFCCPKMKDRGHGCLFWSVGPLFHPSVSPSFSVCPSWSPFDPPLKPSMQLLKAQSLFFNLSCPIAIIPHIPALSLHVHLPAGRFKKYIYVV